MSSQKQRKRIDFIQELFENNPQLFNHSKIPEIKSKGENRVVAVLPLNYHNIYGETVLRINELYNESDNIKEYRYAWEYPDLKGIKKRSKHKRHITSFDKQEHPEPPWNVDTDPFHHHNVPGNTSLRTKTSIKTLEDVVTIFTDYIVSHNRFMESHIFYYEEL